MFYIYNEKEHDAPPFYALGKFNITEKVKVKFNTFLNNKKATDKISSFYSLLYLYSF